ncbi:MAG TPA: hypothetical protein VG937_25055 [Polyangiaceae bacterium]|nr:hypothetical protein [Polyangiaceae bacterium]
MPILDTLLTGFEVVRTGLAIGADSSTYSDPNQPLSREADIALGVGFTALFLGSAIYGYSATARCDQGPRGEAVQAAAPDTDPPERWSGPDTGQSAAKSGAAVRPAASAAPAASGASAEAADPAPAPALPSAAPAAAAQP